MGSPPKSSKAVSGGGSNNPANTKSAGNKTSNNPASSKNASNKPSTSAKNSNKSNGVGTVKTAGSPKAAKSGGKAQKKAPSQAPASKTKSSSSSWRSILMQALVVAIYNMAPLGTGITIGFMGMSLPQVRQDKGLGTVTLEDISWIASLPSIGGVLGSLVGMLVEDRLGRRGTFLAGCLPAALGAMSVAMAPDVLIMLVGCFFCGLGGTLLMSAAQVYLPEVCEPHLRGLFLSSGGLCFTLGNLFGYILGAMYPWRVVLWCASIPYVLGILSWLLPESPSWLASKGRKKDVEDSLRRLRGPSADIKAELRLVLDVPRAPAGGKWALVFTRESLYPLFIVWTLFFISAFSGSAVIMSYTKDIFTSSGGVDGETATLLTGGLQVVLNVLTGFLMQKVGRRPLLVTSGAGMAASLLLFVSNDMLHLGLSWLPSASIWLYLCFLVPGFMVIPFMMMGVLFPLRTRGLLCCLTSCFFSLCMFLATKSYPFLLAQLGKERLFAAFAAVSAFGAVFAAAVVPETKDKSLAEIQAFFKRSSMKKKKK